MSSLPEKTGTGGSLREQAIEDRIQTLVDEIDRQFVRELLQGYIPEAEHKITALTEAWKTSNVEAVKDIAHSLKGSSSNLGAMILSSLFDQVQQTIDQNDPAHLNNLFSQINTRWSITRDHLKSLIGELA